jgi:RNA polymerase sigma-70 factor (ECF subfamily)
MDLLGDSVTRYSDGGGKAAAARKVLVGRDEIARFLVNVARTRPTTFKNVRSTSFNGAPGALFLENGHVVTAVSLEIRGGRIVAIFTHRNPDKLRRFELGN